MTNIADTPQKIVTIASQRGQQDELTSLIIHALKQPNGVARMTVKASPLGSATPEIADKRRPSWSTKLARLDSRSCGLTIDARAKFQLPVPDRLRAVFLLVAEAVFATPPVSGRVPSLPSPFRRNMTAA
jgi:hypothetical protein